ncbi:cell division control protein 31 [Colletotrichum scovillei]|uniref:Cell division control protein 31 n=1 Tax=Colletotrichum scovillei TaxID=1209932 RepID=A0A9P7UBY1_9PEZI|nr:cell division control protein 31 [Colletotrichum scovillei]KAG7052724.1 cell division control protein 31 [Colletotrichum scovillei]KAG7065018.1 cell division control protein 31 [Colletotrichum scovillei]
MIWLAVSLVEAGKHIHPIPAFPSSHRDANANSTTSKPAFGNLNKLLLTNPPLARNIRHVNHPPHIRLAQRRIHLAAHGPQTLERDPPRAAGVKHLPRVLGLLLRVAAHQQPRRDGGEVLLRHAQAGRAAGAPRGVVVMRRDAVGEEEGVGLCAGQVEADGAEGKGPLARVEGAEALLVDDFPLLL